MNTYEKRLARLKFRLKVYEKNGQAFEDFFVRVMQAHNPNFIPIKPQGRYGDRKNDGFDRTTGVYYQVYAPEDITARESETIEKLNTDFQGLYNYWHSQVCPIKEFYFVVNDKYKGVYPSLFPELEKIKKSYEVNADSFLAKNLEDIFLELSDEAIIDVLDGFEPLPENISAPDYSVLREVVNYLNDLPYHFSAEEIPEHPDFARKIIFNKLSSGIARRLDNGRIHTNDIYHYFRNNSEFPKEDLRLIFNSLYQEAVDKIPENEDKGDEVFLYILKKATPRQTKPIVEAVLILMAYYFEFCDIYEAPPGDAEPLTLF
ncbi:MAG: hypothetical protein K9J37_04535 [Saprospiraceae bacterium]|nr:hypothetical protein [Saprospiraceae bacterium]MCF8249153.1 hypothetical protein [Saprospiraceae bacterium]MCF8278905.1 hypothetical protein [Bacteroidales bacterium]MCF8311282.1 hypothetical protein [Saprospiraceae bacterium]MCF8440154.1 hypothetical protein [Saprospiraceae bacterium]